MLMDYKHNIGTLWIWIGAILLLLDILVVNGGPAAWSVYYGLTYALGWLAIGIILSIAKPTVLGALCATFAGLFAVALNFSILPAYVTQQMAFGATAVLFIAILLFESHTIKIGKQQGEAKYLTFIALGTAALWGFLYLYNRITSGGTLPLNVQTVLYHGGIMLLAGFDVVTLLHTGKSAWKIRLILAAIAILGALLVTWQLGWGLTLAQL